MVELGASWESRVPNGAWKTLHDLFVLYLPGRGQTWEGGRDGVGPLQCQLLLFQRVLGTGTDLGPGQQYPVPCVAVT